VTSSSLDTTAEHLLRDLAPQVLGAVIRRFRDFAAAEGAVQEALLAAALQWPREGVSDTPRTWLIHVAYRRMTDYLRRDLTRRRETAAAMESESKAPATVVEDETHQDDTLILLFMCCHPALTPLIGNRPDIALRSELSGEAIRLARAVRTSLPDDAAVAGLLALMLLTDARRAARTGPDGELIRSPNKIELCGIGSNLRGCRASHGDLAQGIDWRLPATGRHRR